MCWGYVHWVAINSHVTNCYWTFTLHGAIRGCWKTSSQSTCFRHLICILHGNLYFFVNDYGDSKLQNRLPQGNNCCNPFLRFVLLLFFSFFFIVIFLVLPIAKVVAFSHQFHFTFGVNHLSPCFLLMKLWAAACKRWVTWHTSIKPKLEKWKNIHLLSVFDQQRQ